MSLQEIIAAKGNGARSVIEKCIGKTGVWASSELETRELPGYRGLCWTRDFAIGGIDGLLAIGREDVVLQHLGNIHLEDDGSVDTYFRDGGFNWKADKVRLLMEDPRRIFPYASKIIQKALGRFSHHSYTAQSTDPALQYINAILNYVERTGRTEILDRYKNNIERALEFAEKTHFRDGLYRGGDWRDNMEFPKEVALLSNNSMLFRIYTMLGSHDKAIALKTKIQNQFWRDGYHSDHPETDEFDSFGEALAVLYGVADSHEYEQITLKFRQMETPFGIKANDYDLSAQPRIVQIRNSRVSQYGTIWPWAAGHIILALEKMGKHDFAIEALNTWSKLDGFREWYNPSTGEGRGAKNFMASAALYLKAGQELKLLKAA